jgi:hypothetical protein
LGSGDQLMIENNQIKVTVRQKYKRPMAKELITSNPEKKLTPALPAAATIREKKIDLTRS